MGAEGLSAARAAKHPGSLFQKQHQVTCLRICVYSGSLSVTILSLFFSSTPESVCVFIWSHDKCLQAHLFLWRFTDIAYFYQLKVWDSLEPSKSISAIFPTAFAHFMFLVSHFGNSHISNFFSCYMCHSDLWSVIFDVAIAIRGFPGGAVVKNLPANRGDTRDMGSISGWGRCPGEGNGNPLQYSCLENSIDKGAWWATIPVANSQTPLSNWAHNTVRLPLAEGWKDGYHCLAITDF